MSTYSIVELPGWEQISLDPADEYATDRRLSELAHQSVPEVVPRDTATPFRREVRKQLDRVATAARRGGASVLCLPVTNTGGHPVPATYTVGEWGDAGTAQIAPGEVIGAMADGSEADARVVAVDGQPALREEVVVAADPAADPLATHAARRVTYTIASPDDGARWLIFTFATLGNGDPDGPLARVLVDLFDAHIGTLTWTRS